ncbi:MAG: hypothetical protein Kow0075_05660 [Salibacteraceae bacterium]
MKKLTLMICLLGMTCGSQAQEYDREYTVKYINDRLSDVCRLFDEKRNLRLEFYAKGEPVRIDYIFPESVDFEKGVYYSESEKAVIITCYDQAGKCIEREILKHGSKIFYDRTNLETDCESENCQALVNAVRHLIMLYVLDDVERTTPFEEN